MVIVGSIRRATHSFEQYGRNVQVLLHIGDDQRIDAIIHTDKNYLIIYSVSLDSQPGDTSYKLDSSKSDNLKRRPFVDVADAETILPYYIKYRRTIKVDSGLSS